jgi:hypothetical protein
MHFNSILCKFLDILQDIPCILQMIQETQIIVFFLHCYTLCFQPLVVVEFGQVAGSRVAEQSHYSVSWTELLSDMHCRT